MHVLQVEALCWCGKRATHNARTEDGVMVVEGEVIVVGDVETPEGPPAEVAYEVLCRQHHRRRLTAARAQAVSMIGDPLPFG
jgi:thymidine kinase